MFITNAFSPNMLSDKAIGAGATISFTPITLNLARELAANPELISAVGHETTATLLTNILGTLITSLRANVLLEKGDSCLLAQYRGPRLGEGATTLPEGAVIEFFMVKVWST